MGQQPYQHLVDNQEVIKFIKRRRLQPSRTEPELLTPVTEENLSAGLSDNSNQKNQNESYSNVSVNQAGKKQSSSGQGDLLEPDADSPPLPLPHDNTPHPLYSIMCACWATNPKNRPDFEEIANRLYWCLQKPEVLNTSLPSFYEPQRSPTAISGTSFNLGSAGACSNVNHADTKCQMRSESRQSGANNTQTTQLNWS